MKAQLQRTRNRYLLAALFCGVFAAVYEHFSHQVYSDFMIFAFLFPLLGGALPYALLCRSRGGGPGILAQCLYDSGIAALTVGSIYRGILEIYGSTSRLNTVYWVAGALLAALGTAAWLMAQTARRATE